MIQKFEFSAILGWSVSRYDLFSICKRKYYYNYYAKYDTEQPLAKITALKKMTSIPLEIGNIVHDINKVLLERLLKTEEPIDQQALLDYAQKMTHKYCNKKVFSEVYYSQRNQINIDEDVFAPVKTSLFNFLTSNRFEWIVKEAVTNKTGWIIEPAGFGETRIDNMKAYCKVDFLFPVQDKVYILDWKTGKPNDDKHNKQLLGYTAWASFHLNIDPSNIIPIIAYMQPDYSEMQLTTNELDLQALSHSVKQETKEMYAFCNNTEENIPKDKPQFPKTENTQLCDYCNFKELCFANTKPEITEFSINAKYVK